MNPSKAKTFLELFRYHLENHSTGKPSEFAAKLGVSRATLYRFINDLRDEGLEVRFSRSQNSFYITPTTISELSKLAISRSIESQNLQPKDPRIT